ncbi:hypothetical protein SBP18_17025 [Rhodoferax ferrireducens]|uniref:hypothetical protein n=1 Tax=Rhodoferax ferrireducens TaxID=192843 RepID=UPI00298E6A75|nr:hypothetical protein [Rhodoferax ferrireducens]WPC66174.1 hypothetical protein SBP18_17025 [Rhodoferax ferrireducens]
MSIAGTAFGFLPAGLREPLLSEYRTLIQNYLERRWTPASLSGGKFCEIVYTIVDGFGSGAYAIAPSKPGNMVNACRALENRTNVPRSFQILIPRLLPALYEVRNNRGVGHVGGDVDPNHMDSAAVLAITNWIMAELVRVFHATSPTEAQQIVDALSTRRIPLVWDGANGVRRVLDPNVSLKDQILVLLGASPRATLVSDLFTWTGCSTRAYFNRLLKALAKGRMIEMTDGGLKAILLPPGSARVEIVIQQHELKYAT